MTDPKETITIENVVASTGIGQELDLQSVAMDLEGADYDPEQFPGLVYRTTDPKSAALIFRSGKIVYGCQLHRRRPRKPRHRVRRAPRAPDPDR